VILDGLLTPPGVLEPSLKAIQDRLAGELDRSGPLLVGVSSILFGHRMTLLVRWMWERLGPILLLACTSEDQSRAANDAWYIR